MADLGAGTKQTIDHSLCNYDYINLDWRGGLVKSHNGKRLRRNITRTGVIAALASLMLLAPTAAEAASWHSISGSTYSAYGTWYISSTQRFKVGEGQVQAKFSKVPNYGSGLPDGLWFDLVNFNNIGLYPAVLFNASNTAKNLGLLPAGQGFKNAFMRAHTCNNCDHNFIGEEYY